MANLNDREPHKREVYETTDTSGRVVQSTDPNRVVRREVHETVDHSQPIEHRVVPSTAPEVEHRYVAGDRDTNVRETNIRDTSVRPAQPSPIAANREAVVRRGPFSRNPVPQERHVQHSTPTRITEAQRVRDNDNAARGLMVGIILTSLAGLVIGTLFALNQRNQTPAPVAPVVLPNTPVSPASPQTAPQVIERDRLVPAPQQSAPDAGGVAVPGAGQAPASQTAPAQTGASTGGTVQANPAGNVNGTETTTGTTGTTGTTTGTTGTGTTTGTTGTTTGTTGTTGTTTGNTGTGTAGSAGTSPSTTGSGQ